jgi:unsaturated chondroitin disaccharide hydrolase
VSVGRRRGRLEVAAQWAQLVRPSLTSLTCVPACLPACLPACYGLRPLRSGHLGLDELSDNSLCDVLPSDPWGSSSGCCCCAGECLYKACPPCPCPPPAPGQKPEPCTLSKLKAAFESKYKAVLSKTTPAEFPAKTAANGNRWTWAYSPGWTSGFFPGLLWQLSNATGDEAFQTAAAQWTAGRESEKTETSGHDIGFMIFGSFGNGIQLGSANATYSDVVIEAAHSLAKRYNPKVGMTRSWGAIDDDKSFEVIIDNLMNLELLFWAGQKSGNETLSDMAKSHATRTGKLWIRPDGSTAHLCVFSPETGELQKPCTGTPQGLAADSTWARGQAWGIYGWTLAYRYTRDQSYLSFAETASKYYLAALTGSTVDTKTLIPKWDFNATASSPGGGDAKDTSAAAIAASAMLELAVYTSKPEYHHAAVHIINSIGWVQGLLSGADSDAVLAGNQHDCGSDKCTLIETEYYMYEALRRLGGAFPPETRG